MCRNVDVIEFITRRVGKVSETSEEHQLDGDVATIWSCWNYCILLFICDILAILLVRSFNTYRTEHLIQCHTITTNNTRLNRSIFSQTPSSKTEFNRYPP